MKTKIGKVLFIALTVIMLLVCVGVSWIIMSLLGCLPFWLSREIPRFIDAFFEIVSGFTTTGTWKGSLTVGGKTEAIHWFGAVSGNWVTVHAMTATVSHNTDGSGSCYLYGKVNGPTETSLEGIYVSGSATLTLETIARCGYLLTAPDFP